MCVCLLLLLLEEKERTVSVGQASWLPNCVSAILYRTKSRHLHPKKCFPRKVLAFGRWIDRNRTLKIIRHIIGALWCSGSIQDSGSWDPSSNLGGAETFFALTNFLVNSLPKQPSFFFGGVVALQLSFSSVLYTITNYVINGVCRAPERRRMASSKQLQALDDVWVLQWSILVLLQCDPASLVDIHLLKELFHELQRKIVN